MEMNIALGALSALAQPVRLEVFRLLIRAGADGLAAGEIARRLEIRPNTLSANLAILTGAGLLRSAREGRSVRYFADMERVRALMAFLLEECCGGDPELCRPVLDDLADCAC